MRISLLVEQDTTRVRLIKRIFNPLIASDALMSTKSNMQIMPIKTIKKTHNGVHVNTNKLTNGKITNGFILAKMSGFSLSL